MTSMTEVYNTVFGGGCEEDIKLLPYAQELIYSEGYLSFTLVFYNDEHEAHINISMELDESLTDEIDRIMGLL